MKGGLRSKTPGPQAPNLGFEMIYDTARGVILEGGSSANPAPTSSTSAGRTDGTYERDTWEWDGTVWEQVADIGPVPRHGHPMTGTAGATLLFGGLRSGGLRTSSSATPGPGRGTLASEAGQGPSPWAGHAPTWDAARNRGVLFGGVILVAGQETPAGDTWESFETP